MERASQHRRTDHDNKHKNRENKVRRALMRHGFILQRDRTRNRTLMRHGHYRVVSIATGNVAFGEFYDWTIDDIEAMVNLLSLREFLHARSREAYPRTMLHAR